MDSARVRFYVRRQPDGRWTFGRQDMPFQVFSSKCARSESGANIALNVRAVTGSRDSAARDSRMRARRRRAASRPRS
jgi:hypothetical protein